MEWGGGGRGARGEVDTASSILTGYQSTGKAVFMCLLFVFILSSFLLFSLSCFAIVLPVDLFFK